MKILKNSKYAPIRFEASNPRLIKLIKKHLSAKSKIPLPYNDPEKIGEIVTFVDYYKNGKIIYDITAELREMLFNSDVLNVSCANIHYPHHNFYLHIADKTIEGLYFNKNANVLNLTIVHQEFGLMPLTLTLNDEQDIATVIQDELNQASIKLTNIYGEYYIYKEIAYLTLPLLFNFLLYLTAKEDDILYDWSNDVPHSRIDRLGKTTNLALAATQEKVMNSEGYKKVYYVGRKFSQKFDTRLAGLSGQIRSPHYRRGHFRLQPYGKNLELRKVIFVPPTFVNATNAEEITMGRIYKVP